MRILLHRADGNTAPWVADFAQALPEAEVIVWKEGEPIAPCDYAVLWSPPAALVPELQHVTASFLTGAGVDAILKFDDQLPDVPIIRLGDAGMAIQMAEYVTHAVLGYYRRMPEYAAQARQGEWKQLPQHRKEDFTVGGHRRAGHARSRGAAPLRLSGARLEPFGQVHRRRRVLCWNGCAGRFPGRFACTGKHAAAD